MNTKEPQIENDLTAEGPEKIPEIQVENPANMYDDPVYTGPRKTRWDSFRAWSHGNKRVIFLLLLFAIGGSIAMLNRASAPENMSAIIKAYFARFTDPKKEWGYSTGTYYIQSAHLKQQFQALSAYTYGPRGGREMAKNPLAYHNYVNQELETDLMVEAALREGVLNTEKARQILEHGVRKLVADYYLSTKLYNNNSDFRVRVTDKEVEEFYEKNKASYVAKSISRAQALPAIRLTLEEVEKSRLRSRLVNTRAGLIKVLKDSSGYKIKR